MKHRHLQTLCMPHSSDHNILQAFKTDKMAATAGMQLAHSLPCNLAAIAKCPEGAYTAMTALNAPVAALVPDSLCAMRRVLSCCE